MENSADRLKLSTQLCFPLYAAARKVVNLYTPYLKPFGITYTQYIVFLALWEYGSMSVGELCKKLYLDTGTITPMLKKMEETGWVRRSRMPEDERTVLISLTDAGINLKSEIEHVPYQVGSCIGIETEEAEKLYSLLYRVLEIPTQQSD